VQVEYNWLRVVLIGQLIQPSWLKLAQAVIYGILVFICLLGSIRVHVHSTVYMPTLGEVRRIRGALHVCDCEISDLNPVCSCRQGRGILLDRSSTPYVPPPFAAPIDPRPASCIVLYCYPDITCVPSCSIVHIVIAGSCWPFTCEVHLVCATGRPLRVRLCLAFLLLSV